MKIGLIIFFSCCTLYACKQPSHKEGADYDTLLIEYISNADTSLSIPNIMLFSETKDRLIGYLDTYSLQKIYDNDPKYRDYSYEDFVSGVLKKSLPLDCSDILDCFSPNDTITNIYRSNNINSFLRMFYDKTESDTKEFRLKNNLSVNAKLTIIYYAFINGYYTTYDDYIGFYYSRKLQDFDEETAIDPKSLSFEKE